MPVPPGVFGKKVCRLGSAHPRSLKLTSLMRLLKPVMTLQDRRGGTSNRDGEDEVDVNITIM